MLRNRAFLIPALALTILIAFFLGGRIVSALSEKELLEYSMNNILFYEPCPPASSGDALGGDIAISGSTAEEKLWSGLKSFLDDVQAAGVMGNIGQEDGNYNPVRREVGQSGSLYNRNDQMGLGFVQWSFGRRVDLLNYIKERDGTLIKYFEDDSLAQISGDEFIKKAGESDANKIFQLEIEFMKSEIDKSYKKYYEQTDIDKATVWFRENFERAGVYSDQFRIEKAHAAYNKYAGKTISGGGGMSSGSDPACNSCSKGSMNINGTAVCLAWPLGTDKSEWGYVGSAYGKGNEWTGGKATDAFNKAFDDDEVFGPNSNSPHKNWGHCPSIGASCDVGSATAVRYSGVDPNFPRGLSEQVDHVKSHPEIWELLDSSASPQAGDVVWYTHSSGGHIYIVVQDEKGDFYRAESGLCSSFFRISGKFNGFESNAKVFRAKIAKNSTAGVDVENGVSTSSSTGTLSNGTSTGNQDIGANAFYFAWPDGEFQNKMKPESKDAWYKMAKDNNVSIDSHVEEGASCVVFVWGVLRYSGLIENFKISERLDEQLEKEPDWTKVQSGSIDKSQMKDGDVLIYRCNRYGSSSYPCHYGIYAEKDGEGYTIQASNPSGCSSNCDYRYPWVTKGFNPGNWTDVWRNSKNKSGGGACNVCDGGGSESDGALVAGGYKTKEEADKAIMEPYRNASNSELAGLGITVGCNGWLADNCPSFSRYFFNKFTNKKWTGPTGNGKDVTSYISKAMKLKIEDQPKAYAIFSGPSDIGTPEGHTGVILGVDLERKKVIIGEAGYCSGKGFMTAKEKDLSKYTSGKYTFIYTDGILKSGGVK